VNALKLKMEPPNEKPASKELEILEVAAGYFLSHGYRGTSISGMAREAGISKESIYRYFSSKQALFEAVIARELTEYRRRLQFLDAEDDPRGLQETLASAAESILSAISSERTLALRRLIFQEARGTPEIGAYYYEIGPREAYRHLTRIFEKHRKGARQAPETMARNFVALTLHYDTLRMECGVTGSLSRQQVKTRTARVTEEFLEVYFE